MKDKDFAEACDHSCQKKPLTTTKSTRGFDDKKKKPSSTSISTRVFSTERDRFYVPRVSWREKLTRELYGGNLVADAMNITKLFFPKEALSQEITRTFWSDYRRLMRDDANCYKISC